MEASAVLQLEEIDEKLEQVIVALNITSQKDKTALRKMSPEAKSQFIANQTRKDQDKDHTNFPEFWVWLIRNQSDRAIFKKLSGVLASQDVQWLSAFIQYKGLHTLIEVHEDLFWRLFYHQDEHDASNELQEWKYMFIECIQCFIPIIKLQTITAKLLSDRKSLVQTLVEILVTSLALTDNTVRLSSLQALRVLCDNCKKTKSGELAQLLWEGLVVLQILLTEDNCYSPLVKLLLEDDSVVTIEQKTGIFYVINTCVSGFRLWDLRDKHRKGFSAAGVAKIIKDAEESSGKHAKGEGYDSFKAEIERFKLSERVDSTIMRNTSPYDARSAFSRAMEQPLEETAELKSELRLRMQQRKEQSQSSITLDPPTQPVAKQPQAKPAPQQQQQHPQPVRPVVVRPVEPPVDEEYTEGDSYRTLGSALQRAIEAKPTPQQPQQPQQSQHTPPTTPGRDPAFIYEVPTTKGDEDDEGGGSAYEVVTEEMVNEKKGGKGGEADDEDMGGGTAYEEIAEGSLGEKEKGKEKEKEKEKVKKEEPPGDTTYEVVEEGALSKDAVAEKPKKGTWLRTITTYETVPEGALEENSKGKEKEERDTPKENEGGEGGSATTSSEISLEKIAVQEKGLDDSFDIKFASLPKDLSGMISSWKKAQTAQPQSPNVYWHVFEKTREKGSLSLSVAKEKAIATPKTQEALISLVKQGELHQWTVATGFDNRGIPSPVSKFEPIWFVVDQLEIYVYKSALEAVAEVSVPLLDIKKVIATPGKNKDWEGWSGIDIIYRDSDKQKQYLTLATRSVQERDWWIKGIFMNKAIDRDWNKEFQAGIEAYKKELNSRREGLQSEKSKVPKNTLHELSSSHITLHTGKRGSISVKSWTEGQVNVMQREKPTSIGKLVNEFTMVAQQLAQIIVDELHVPEKDKVIPPSKLGGVAGGEKYISHGIFFKFSIDRGLYGGDEFAMKATGHEMKGLVAYIDYSMRSQFPYTLSFPIFNIIDYKGYRLSAISILPVSGAETLIYGSADSGRTVHNKYQEINALMKKAGRYLNLKPHWIVERRPLPPGATERQKVYLTAPGDIEGHLGHDGRFYVLDTARVFPPETPVPELKGSFLYRLLRPEYVKAYPVPLCSDAFCGWGNDPKEPAILKSHNEEVRHATTRLVDVIVPWFAKRLEAIYRQSDYTKGQWYSVVEDARIMVINLHRAGINLRYLGRIRSLVTPPVLKRWLLIEVIARVAKNELRNVMRTVQSPDVVVVRKVVCDFFHQLLHDPNKNFWMGLNKFGFNLKSVLTRTFPYCLSEEELKPTFDLRTKISLAAVFQRVSYLSGIKFSESIENRLWLWERRYKGVRLHKEVKPGTRVTPMSTDKGDSSGNLIILQWEERQLAELERRERKHFMKYAETLEGSKLPLEIAKIKKKKKGKGKHNKHNNNNNNTHNKEKKKKKKEKEVEEDLSKLDPVARWERQQLLDLQKKQREEKRKEKRERKELRKKIEEERRLRKEKKKVKALKRRQKWPISLIDLEEALVSISPKIQQLPIISFIQAIKKEGETERKWATTSAIKEKLWAKAQEFYLSGLELKPDDTSILPHLAKVFVALANVKKEQLKQLEEVQAVVDSNLPYVLKQHTLMSISGAMMARGGEGFDYQDMSDLADSMATRALKSHVEAQQENLKKQQHQQQDGAPTDLAKDLPKVRLLTSLEMVRLYRLADRQYEDAIELDPADARLMFDYAQYLVAYRPLEVSKIEHYFIRALRVNPHDSNIILTYKQWKAKKEEDSKENEQEEERERERARRGTTGPLGAPGTRNPFKKFSV